MKWLIIISLALLQTAHTYIRNNRSQLKRCMLASNELDENACNSRPSPADYYANRKQFIDEEIAATFGSDIKLNENELLANEIVMTAKEAEYIAGFEKPYLFNPSRHIFEILNSIKQSKLFQIIQRMPKGGILHAHDTALCSTDFIVSLTYWPYLWQRTPTDNNEIIEFKFSRQQPAKVNEQVTINETTTTTNTETIWRLVKDVRAKIGSTKYDEYVRSLFTLFDKNINPKIQFHDINDVWSRFMSIFIRLGSIVTYAPVWKAYYKHALKEMLGDSVQYLEFRGVLPQVNHILICILHIVYSIDSFYVCHFVFIYTLAIVFDNTSMNS